MMDENEMSDSSSTSSSSASSSESTKSLTNDMMERVHQEFYEQKTFNEKFEVIWHFFSHAFPKMFNDFGKVEKSIEESQRWREIGNKKYKAKKYEYLKNSIEAFTKSIAAAPLKSKELSLAYANRSAALLKARLFEDCLLDIERALASGYPDNLKAKLFARQSLCFRGLMPSLKLESKIPLANTFQWLPAMNRKDPSYSTVFNILTNYKKFSKSLGKPRGNVNTGIFIPKIRNKNPNFIGASDAIAIKTTKKNGRHIVATRDINPGEFIYADKPFETMIGADKRFTQCWHCYAETYSGLPCDDCPNVIFCSQACKDASWKEYHDLECPVLSTAIKMKLDLKDEMAVRILTRALKSAGSLSALTKQIHDIDSDSKNPEPTEVEEAVIAVNSLENFHRVECVPAESTRCSVGEASHALLLVMRFGLDTDVLGSNSSCKDVYRHKDASILGGLILRYFMIVQKHLVAYVQSAEDDKLVFDSCAVSLIRTEFKSDLYTSNSDLYTHRTIFSIAVDKPISKGKMVILDVDDKTKDEFLEGINLLNEKGEVCTQCSLCVDRHLHPNIPSFRSMNLPRKVLLRLGAIMTKSADLMETIHEGNPKLLTKIMKDLIRFTKELHAIPKTCTEARLFSSMIRDALRKLHCRRSIFD